MVTPARYDEDPPAGEGRAERPSGVAARRLGPYLLGATLGRGGFGTVHRALDERSGATVALKVLHREVARDPELLGRFLREALTTSAADNPHVVRVIDAHEDLDGFACIAFELLVGETLEARLRREGALAPNEAVDLAVQILDGLEVAHERGIVHRDVKPANLFLVEDGMRGSCVKILDFGVGRLATAAAKRTATGMSLGSPFYMAPEQVFDSARADARADLYGVAVCLFRMLTGGLPHGEGPAPVWMAFVVEGRTAPRASSPYGVLPETLTEAVALGLSPRAEARWQNAGAFSSALLDSLPGASAPTRVSYEPAVVLRAPIPAPHAFAGSAPTTEIDHEPHDVRRQPYAGRSGAHVAIRQEPPRSVATAPEAHVTGRGRAIAFEAVAEQKARPWTGPAPTSRNVIAVAVVACAVMALALLVGGIALAFFVGEVVGRQDARSPRARSETNAPP